MLSRATWWVLGALLVVALALVLLPGCAVLQPPPTQVQITVSNCAGWRRPPLPLSEAEIAALRRVTAEWIVATDAFGRASGCWE